jgi:hypothetical protein
MKGQWDVFALVNERDGHYLNMQERYGVDVLRDYIFAAGMIGLENQKGCKSYNETYILTTAF